MSNSLDTANAAQYINLITFMWQDGTATARYATSEKPITLSGNTFAAAPAISITFDKQKGGVEDVPVKIQMPALDPVAGMLTAYPFRTVKVLIEEVDPSDVTTRRKMFSGTVTQCTGNKNGYSGLCEIQVSGIKYAFEALLGIPVLNTCAWLLGDKNCTVNTSPLQQTLTVDSITGNLLKCSGGFSQRAKLPRGYATVNGLSIMIIDLYVGDYTTLTMAGLPPPSWVGQSVTLNPGCLKTIGDCTGKYNNATNFGGFGFGLPAFNPATEIQ